MMMIMMMMMMMTMMKMKMKMKMFVPIISPKLCVQHMFWSTTLSPKHPWLTDCLTCLFVNKTLPPGGYSFPLVCLGFSTNQVRNFNGWGWSLDMSWYRYFLDLYEKNTSESWLIGALYKVYVHFHFNQLYGVHINIKICFFITCWCEVLFMHMPLQLGVSPPKVLFESPFSMGL